MRPQFWIILELHCHLPEPDQASVWISGRPLSPDRALEEDVARKLCGPLPWSAASQLAECLRAELEVAGLEVAVEYAADD